MLSIYNVTWEVCLCLTVGTLQETRNRLVSSLFKYCKYQYCSVRTCLCNCVFLPVPPRSYSLYIISSLFFPKFTSLFRAFSDKTEKCQPFSHQLSEVLYDQNAICFANLSFVIPFYMNYLSHMVPT